MLRTAYSFDIPDFTIVKKLDDLRPEYLGEYYQAIHRDGTQYILKFGPIDKLTQESEIQIPIDGILKIHHPHVSGMKMAIPYESPYNWECLKTVIDQRIDIPEGEIIGWAYDILVTLRDLQDCRIYHNNLCLEGSLLCTILGEKHVKLTGLSARKVLTPMESRVPSVDNIITPCSSPEQLNGHPLTRTTDIWSLGVMLYYACCHKYPYTDDTKQLAGVLDTYRNEPGIDPIPSRYSNIKAIIERYMLRFNQKDRLTPSEILQLPIFTQISGGPLKMSYIVCRSNNAKYNNNYDGGIYHIGQISEVSNKTQVEWYGIDDPKIVPLQDIEVCTRNEPGSGLIPLTVGTKVIRGPDWDDDRHGINDASGLGTVINIVPGFEYDFNTVNVLWSNDRVVRYFYGVTSTISTAEILPAYPPIVPGMKVHNLPGGQKLDGIIISVSDTKDTATILLESGGQIEMSYGKDSKFGFVIDKIYYENKAVQSVQTYIQNFLEYHYDDDDRNDSAEADRKSKMVNGFRRNQIGVQDRLIDVGMFVWVPPEIKNCLYCRVIGRTGDNLKLIAVCASYTVPVTKTVTINMVKQCTYGTPKHPPIPLGSNIVTTEGESGKLEYITYTPPEKGNEINGTVFYQSWKYAICKMQTGYQCFKFDEITAARGGK